MGNGLDRRKKRGSERRMGKGLESRKKRGMWEKDDKGIGGKDRKKRNCKEGWEKRLKRRTGIVNEDNNRTRDWREGHEKALKRRNRNWRERLGFRKEGRE
jgi:hypothetical protein